MENRAALCNLPEPPDGRIAVGSDTDTYLFYSDGVVELASGYSLALQENQEFLETSTFVLGGPAVIKALHLECHGVGGVDGAR